MNEVAVRRELDRRKPGQNPWSTHRNEADLPQVMSGIYRGYTTGAPIAVFFKNQDTRSQDYSELETHFRPSHADFTGMIRYEGYNDPRGGGHFSGRLTTGMVYAGALAKQLLSHQGIDIKGHLSQVGHIKDVPLEGAERDQQPLSSDFPMYSAEAATAAKAVIELARATLDSVGAEVEVAAFNLPQGLGNPIFENVESHIASALFGIPGIKGIAFGSGFDLVAMRGSEANDRIYEENGKVKTMSNHSGGINGGITNGMPLIVRAAVKPTASIGLPQETLKADGHMELLQIKGRHDPCIGPRALPVVEGLLAFALADLLIGSGQIHLGAR